MKRMKKIKTIKKTSISIAFCVMASCMVGGVVSWSTWSKANAEENPTCYTLEGFQIQEKASVRKTNPNGIRFTTTLNGAKKTEIDNLLDNYTYGTIMIPVDFLGSNELTHSIANIQDISVSKWQNDYQYTSVLTGKDNGDGTFENLPASYYNRPIAARAYVTGTNADGNTVTYYSENTAVRSIGYVAYMAQQNGESSELIDDIVETVNMELVFIDELSAYKSANEGVALIYNTYSNASDKVAALKIGGIIDTTGVGEIQYQTSDANIISVDGETLTAVGVGTATITASCELNGETKTIQKTFSTDRYVAKSDYKILVPSSASTYVTQAAEKLQSILKESTGITLEIATETGSESTEDKYISVGETVLAKNTASISVSDLTKATASRVKTVKNTVFLRGVNDLATLYGAQEWLGDLVGYEFFLENTHSVEEKEEAVAVDKDYIPDLEYTLTEYYEESLGIIDDYAMRQIYNGVISVGKGANGYDLYAHNSTAIVNDGTYDSTSYVLSSKSYKKWYATTSNGLSYWTTYDSNGVEIKAELCYTAHGDSTQRSAMVEKVATALANAILAEEDKSIDRVAFSQADHTMWCSCSNCSSEGNPSDNMLHFVLDVVPAVKTKLGNDPRAATFKISTMFYCATNMSPKSIGNYVTEDTKDYMKHIEIWFAPIGADYIEALDAVNATNDWNETSYASLQDWAGIANTYGCDLLLWTYHSNANSFFVPYDSFDAIRGNYAIAKTLGVDYVFNQMMGAQVNWTRLKQYLISELAWNADPTDDEWTAMIDLYFAGAYGTGSTEMKNYFNAWNSWTDSNADLYRRSGDYDYTSTTKESYKIDTRTAANFPVETLEVWIDHCDAAIAALDSSDPNYEIYYKNILLEKMVPLYLMMYIHGGYSNGSFSTTSYVTTYGAAFLECFNAWDSEVFIDGENNVGNIDAFKNTVASVIGTMETVTDKQTVVVGNSATFMHESFATGTYTVTATSGSDSHEYSVTVNDVGTATVVLSDLTAGNTYRVSFVGSGVTVIYTNVFAISDYVSSVEDLVDVSNATDGYYVLTSNIDCANVTLGNTFAGTLDGDGYTVSNYGVSEFLPNATKTNLKLEAQAVQKIDQDFYVSEGETSAWLVNNVFQVNDNYTVTVNGITVNATAYVEGKLRITFASAQLGDTYDVICTNEASGASYAFTGVCASKVLYAEDIANIKTILAENASGYIVLGEDIDFGGASLSGVIANFSGTLDGRGYALKNFSNALGQDGSNWVGYFIKENTGTIKNLLLRFTMTVANVPQDAFIYKNSGTIENVKMDVTYTFTNDPWNPGSLVGLNYGTIKNVVAVFNKTADVTSAKVGCIIGANYTGGTVQNCYVVNNGVVYSGATDGIWVEAVGGSKTNCAAYATMAELAAVANLSSENGWCEYWFIENETVVFGGRKAPVEQVNVTLDSALAEDYSGNIVITLPEDVTPSNVRAILFDETKMTVVSVENNVITIAKNNSVAYGSYTVTIDAENVLCTIASVDYYTKVLTQSDVANFKSILEATPNGYFVFDADIDFGGASLSGVIANFSGTLDGRGYALKNFSNALGQDGSNWVDYFIKENTGTIKNLSLQFTMAVANTTNAALINKNSGTIENVKMDVTYAYTNDPWMPGSLVGINTGIIQNVVAVMNKTAGVVCVKAGCIVGSNQSGTVQNCYVVNNGVVYSEATDGIWAEGWGTKTNCTAYATMSELAAAANFSEINGWSNAWRVVGDTVLFGSEKFSITIDDIIAEGNGENIVITLPENVTLEEVTSVVFGEIAVNVVSVSGNILTVENGALAYGEYDVTVTVVGGTYILNGALYCTAVLEDSDAVNFKTILASTANGYFVLGEDIDFDGMKLAGAIDFSGTLDGRGYALKNFEVNYAGSTEAEGWNSYLFKTTSGTIKNLHIQYTLGTSNTTEGSLIYENKGTIENVMVTVTFTTYSWYTAPIAAYSSGTIRNVVAVMSKTDGFTELSRIGGLIGTNRGVTIENCYVVHNGILNGAEDRMFVDSWGSTAVTNCSAYATMSELAAAANFSTANGWSSDWKIRDNEVVFGNAKAKATIENVVAENKDGYLVVTLPENVNLADVTSVVCNGAMMEIVALSGNVLTLNASGVHYGVYDVSIETSDTIYMLKDMLYCTKVLYATDASNFKTILTENASGYLVLGEDIDFGGASISGVIANFSGTLDGRGYALKNFSNALGQDGSNWVGYFIKENTGTIKNLSLQFTLAIANTTNDAFIYKNSGTIENVKMDVTYAYTNDPWMPGSLVGINTGVIQNVVAVMNKTAGVVCAKAGCIVGSNQSGTVQNCYVVNNGVVYSSATDGIWAEGCGTKTKCTAYATMSELAAAANFSTANGWSEHWSIVNGEVLFGDE